MYIQGSEGISGVRGVRGVRMYIRGSEGMYISLSFYLHPLFYYKGMVHAHFAYGPYQWRGRHWNWMGYLWYEGVTRGILGGSEGVPGRYQRALRGY